MFKFVLKDLDILLKMKETKLENKGRLQQLTNKNCVKNKYT